jgi:hypothetical protein
LDASSRELITGEWGTQDGIKGRRRKKERDVLQTKKAEPEMALL